MSEKLSLSESKRRVWDEVESSLLTMAELAKSDADAAQFYTTLLHRVVECTLATGGALWLKDAQGTLYPAHQVGSADPSRSELWQSLEENVQRTVNRNLGGVTELSSGRLHSALIPTSDSPGVLQVLRPADIDIDSDEQQTVVEAFAELASEYHDRIELSELRQLRSESAAWSDFSKRVHATLEPEQVAYAIANDGRVLLDCDRVSVVECWGRRCKLIAVSGVDSLNRRSDLCRSLERLANYVTKSGDEIWYEGDARALAPQLEAQLEQYIDQSHAKRLVIVPLVAPSGSDDTASATVGALVAESFGESIDAFSLRERIVHLTQHSVPALRNAMVHQHMPLMPVSMALQNFGRFVRLRSLAITMVMLAVAIGIVGLCLIPAELKVEARGELQPLNRRNVFAATDGLINQLMVDHGQTVQNGQLLGTMTRSELEFATSQVTGQILTTQRALNSVRARRLSVVTGSTDSTDQTTLAAEEEQLRLQLKGLEQQAGILRAQQDELEIRSPIDGEVITWDPAQVLLDRPVQRGQQLLTIAAPDGPWIVELKLADKDVGHVVDAQPVDSDGLRVSFLLATNPSETLYGRVQRISLATDRDADGEATVLLTVVPDQPIESGARPGAGVVANIHCRKTSLGYVWLHELLDTVRTTWLF